jgi:putative ABC transport system ATP-binding protein
MIKIQNLNKSYQLADKKIHVLKNLNFEVEKGDFIALTGRSGSGKSTLLNIIGLLDRFDDGKYKLNNLTIENINETESAKLRNKHIGFVFQSFNLLPFKTAIDNVALPLFYQKKYKIKEIELMAISMLNKVGLGDRVRHLPSELSGGQKQRVAIARALITNADVILADEPTGSLDTNTSNEIMDLFQEINSEGKTIIIVTHEKEIASKCKKNIEIRDGEIFN